MIARFVGVQAINQTSHAFKQNVKPLTETEPEIADVCVFKSASRTDVHAMPIQKMLVQSHLAVSIFARKIGGQVHPQSKPCFGNRDGNCVGANLICRDSRHRIQHFAVDLQVVVAPSGIQHGRHDALDRRRQPEEVSLFSDSSRDMLVGTLR